MNGALQVRPSPVPASRGGRAFFWPAVIVLPVVSFWLSHALRPQWQSGKFQDYVVLLVDPAAAWFFFPLLADAAYLSLKPLEWSSRWSLEVLVPGVMDEYARRLYSPGSGGT